MKIQPFGKNVAVRLTRIEETTLPWFQVQSERKFDNMGMVEAVGDNVKAVLVGQCVIFKEFSGSELSYGGETLYMIDEKNILATLPQLPRGCVVQVQGQMMEPGISREGDAKYREVKKHNDGIKERHQKKTMDEIRENCDREATRMMRERGGEKSRTFAGV